MLCFTKYSPHQLFLCHEGFQRAFIKCTNYQDTVERTNKTINRTTYYVSVALFYSAHVLSLTRIVISQAFFLHFTDEDTIQKGLHSLPRATQTMSTSQGSDSVYPGLKHICFSRGLPGPPRQVRDRTEPLPVAASTCPPKSRLNLDPVHASLSGGRHVAPDRDAAVSNRVMFLRDGRTPFPE